MKLNKPMQDELNRKGKLTLALEALGLVLSVSAICGAFYIMALIEQGAL